jgi:hypothetical protein
MEETLDSPWEETDDARQLGTQTRKVLQHQPYEILVLKIITNGFRHLSRCRVFSLAARNIAVRPLPGSDPQLQ